VGVELNRGGVYEIRNRINGKRYVGSTRSFAMRWKQHRKELIAGKHHSPYLQRSYDVHGSEAFEYRVLLLCAVPHLDMYEQRCLDAWKPEYNTSPTAGSTRGLKHSPSVCAAISARSKRMWAENYEKMRAATAGTSWSKDRTGHTAESRAKISAAKLGRPLNYPPVRKSRGACSPALREKIAAAQRGVSRGPLSEAHRAKLKTAQQTRRQLERELAPA